jgi:hypothetical protein
MSNYLFFHSSRWRHLSRKKKDCLMLMTLT